MLIQAQTERLRSRLDPADAAHQDTLEIEQAVNQAAAVTHQLLAFSRRQFRQQISGSFHKSGDQQPQNDDSESREFMGTTSGSSPRSKGQYARLVITGSPDDMAPPIVGTGS